MKSASSTAGPPSRAGASPEEQAAWDKYFDYLIKSLRDPDSTTRAQAARILGENREPRAVPALGSALEDPDGSVRQQAAIALGRIGPAGLEPLIKALEDPDREVRLQATRALGQMGDARVVVPLVACLRDMHDAVRNQAAYALSQIGAPAVDTLLGALRHNDPALRVQAARILGQIGDRRALPELERIAAEDRGVSRATGPLTSVADVARQSAEKLRTRGSR